MTITKLTNNIQPLDEVDKINELVDGVNTNAGNISNKQDTLVSGTNIKTINSTSLLGDGNISIDGLPSQTSQSGKFLTTNGTTASWATVDALPSQTSQSGKYLTTDGTTASWATIDALPSQTSQSGKYLTTDGTTASWSAVNEALAVTDNRSGDAIKIWTGTRAQYEALLNTPAWTTATQNANLGSNNWKSIAWNGSKFVALSVTGYVSESSAASPAQSGNDWTSASKKLDSGTMWYALAYGNSAFVALGLNGYVSTSSNGSTWSTATQKTALAGHSYWYALIYGSNKFVAISSDGYTSTSTDGYTWTIAAQNTNLGSHSWQSITYDGSKFVALGSSGYTSTSTDGDNWTIAAQSTDLGSNYWRAIIWNSAKLVALGRDGYISSSYGNDIDANTLYNVTDDENIPLSLLELLYPIGSIYTGTMATCPLATLGVGTWQQKTTRFLVDKYISGTDWWELYSDGWCVQGGSVSVTAGSSATVTLFKEYMSTDYSLLATSNANYYANVEANSSATKVSTTQIAIYSGSHNTGNFTWETSGYISATTQFNTWERIS